MSFSWMMAALTGALLLPLVPQAARAQGPSDAQVPAELRPPAGARMVLQAFAKGDQVYTCKQENGQYSWVLKAPDAQLFDRDGKTIGRHFAGPSWELNDKSAVTGKMIAHADSPDKASIPWLLVSVVNHSGSGQLSKVTHIQRLNTKDGKAPASGCDAPHAGQESRASYSATYVFYESTPAK